MIIIQCFVRFTSKFSLHQIAGLLSNQLFGGVPFVDTDEFDEIPGVRIKRVMLGVSASICGECPNYGLRIDTEIPVYFADNFPKLEYIDLNPYIEQTLKSIREIDIVPT